MNIRWSIQCCAMNVRCRMCDLHYSGWQWAHAHDVVMRASLTSPVAACVIANRLLLMRAQVSALESFCLSRSRAVDMNVRPPIVRFRTVRLCLSIRRSHTQTHTHAVSNYRQRHDTHRHRAAPPSLGNARSKLIVIY